ncbi:hypothetical protein MSSIT_3181 [Methanosarcina siciliae T4/M]|uniref:Uncharacterized protein n=1 Tax=Methanosarcina siciliae T4/M TaxID=1434120 RepID=A0A0E3P7N2_9EURY|nr:hypothetical protein [Methanosarcina siciliae]AKB29900.1 hypothetical protein MSSIT_3181 [Methanosarcina siciliae T4/M]
MYIKAGCPVCGEPVWFDVDLTFEKEKLYTEEQAYKFTMTNLEITDVVTESVFVKSVVSCISKQCPGVVETDALKEVLNDKFGITEPYIDEFAETIKAELGKPKKRQRSRRSSTHQ